MICPGDQEVTQGWPQAHMGEKGKNLSGKRKNSRGGSRGRGPAEIQTVHKCAGMRLWKREPIWNWIWQEPGFLQVHQQQNNIDSVNSSKNLHVSLLKKVGNSTWGRLGSTIMHPGWCMNLGQSFQWAVHKISVHKNLPALHYFQRKCCFCRF